MNCDKCCGCVPPITTYNPSVADNFPTILQQVEYLKALLKKYPSQQWFITKDKVTETTYELNGLDIYFHNRKIQEGDFILGNKTDGTTLLFQFTGAIKEIASTNIYIVEYVGIYSNEGLASQALTLAQTNEKDIDKIQGRINTFEIVLTPASSTSGTLTQEQYDSLYSDDNGYIKLANTIYKLSKRDNEAGYSVYSSGYLSDTKNVQTITITNSTKGWVLSTVVLESTYLHNVNLTFSGGPEGDSGVTFLIKIINNSNKKLTKAIDFNDFVGVFAGEATVGSFTLGFILLYSEGDYQIRTESGQYGSYTTVTVEDYIKKIN